LNQNLSGFGRARRPATPEWEIALRAPRGGTQRLISWVLASTLIVIALRLSEIARAQGAVRAVMRPRATRAHRSRSRFEPVLGRGRRSSVLSGSGRGCRRRPEAETSARNVEGPPGIPRRPFSTDDGLHHLPGEPPGEPASLPGPGRNAVPTSRARVRPLRERHGHATSIAAGGLCPWLSNTGSRVWGLAWN
jgi:hypothetical protein